jgi:DNA-binding FrmR family transcriptional regulator
VEIKREFIEEKKDFSTRLRRLTGIIRGLAEAGLLF